LPAGEAIVSRRASDVVLVGVDPFAEDGQLYEGLIANPRRA
jgi:hypothetical protein